MPMAPGKGKSVATKVARPNRTSRQTEAKLKTRDEDQDTNSIPITSQQKCLNIVRDALRPGVEDSGILQEIKGHLFNRDFASAFGREDYLRVYASRWSPSRALGYAQILADIEHRFLNSAAQPDSDIVTKVACVGGGAGAELLGIALWLSHRVSGDNQNRQLIVDATMLDIAEWSTIVDRLYAGVISPPQLSRYASANIKEANKPMIRAEQYKTSFRRQDVLDIGSETGEECFGDTDLMTFMFTLNELYSTSMPKTQQLLEQVTRALRPGTHLLVVDSPGSYSTVSINGSEKKYPMQWLLDYTMLGNPEKPTPAPRWKKLIQDESRWFRLPQNLQYPIGLENMRYQIHLYQRLAAAEILGDGT